MKKYGIFSETENVLNKAKSRSTAATAMVFLQISHI
jgi:hypothetical protein